MNHARSNSDLDAEIRSLKERLVKLRRVQKLRARVISLEFQAAPFSSATIERLTEIVARHYEVDRVLIQSRCRKERIAAARFHIWALARKHTSASLHQLGQLFARDHSAVMNGCRAHADRLETDASYQAKALAIESEFLSAQQADAR